MRPVASPLPCKRHKHGSRRGKRSGKPVPINIKPAKGE
jgi:hypothetical protein